MKTLKISLIGTSLLVLTVFSCKSKNTADAGESAKDISSAAKKHTPGAQATSGTDYYMKATINGKEWNADFILPDESASGSYRTIHGETGNTYINFMLWRNGIALGKEEPFSEEQIANLSVQDVPGFWGGKKGEVKITGLGDKSLEGIFNFEATSSSNPGKTIVVTQGRFRVPLNTK